MGATNAQITGSIERQTGQASRRSDRPRIRKTGENSDYGRCVLRPVEAAGGQPEDAAMGRKQQQDRTSAANALAYFKQTRSLTSNRKRKLPCGQPIEIVLNQEFDCHDDNRKGAKNH
jgi:hypothetical protein